jgi:hypothetical protein
VVEAGPRAHKDYSGTPLWKKLGIKEGSRVLIANAPARFDDALHSLAPVPHAVEFMARRSNGLDVVVLFTTERREMERRFGSLAASLRPAGRLWIAWPKKASNVSTDLSFAIVQTHGLGQGLVDNKTASITAVFQGAQFVYRLKDRPSG